MDNIIQLNQEELKSQLVGSTEKGEKPIKSTKSGIKVMTYNKLRKKKKT